jgi:hypothetical protein
LADSVDVTPWPASRELTRKAGKGGHNIRRSHPQQLVNLIGQAP